MLRGSPISNFGSSDLVRLDVAGRKRWLMQADEMLYLHPDRVRLEGPAIYIASALDAAEDRALLEGLTNDALMAAALACTDEADFRRRVREQRALHGRHGPGASHAGDIS